MPPTPSTSSSNNTQIPAIAKMTTLVYTGTDLSIMRRVPPNNGAIIPPLEQESYGCGRTEERRRTFVRAQRQFRTQFLALTSTCQIVVERRIATNLWSQISPESTCFSSQHQDGLCWRDDLPVQHCPHGLCKEYQKANVAMLKNTADRRT